MGVEIVGGINLNQGNHARHSYKISPDNANLIANIFTLSNYEGAPPIVNGNFSLIEGSSKIVRSSIALTINPTYPERLTIDISDTAFEWDGAWILPFAVVVNIGGTIGTAETITLYGVTGSFASYTTVELASFTSAGSYSFNLAKLFRFSITETKDDWNLFVPSVKVVSNLSTTQATATADILGLVLIDSKQA